MGYPPEAPFVREMRGTPAWSSEDSDPEIDAEIMRKINAEVESLSTLKRAAVRLVYLNEVIAAVFNSHRMTNQEARRLCDQAEIEMVPRLRVRGVVLGGC